jgi:hypothetical protein
MPCAIHFTSQHLDMAKVFREAEQEKGFNLFEVKFDLKVNTTCMDAVYWLVLSP